MGSGGAAIGDARWNAHPVSKARGQRGRWARAQMGRAAPAAEHAARAAERAARAVGAAGAQGAARAQGASQAGSDGPTEGLCTQGGGSVPVVSNRLHGEVLFLVDYCR